MRLLPLTFKVFAGCQGFGQLEDDWRALAGARGYHFTHLPTWYQAELEAAKCSSDVLFAAAYRGEQLAAVIPLVRTKLVQGSLSVPILELFYPNEMGVNDVLNTAADANFLVALTAALRKHTAFFLFIRWQCVPLSGCATQLAGRDCEVFYSHFSKYLDFRAGTAPFWSSYSKKFLKTLNKKKAKAEQLAALRLHCVSEPSQLEAAFQAFLEVEDSGWKGAQGTSVLKQPRKLTYYKKLLQGFGEGGVCRINLLYLGDTVVAAHFGVLMANTMYLLKIGFREEYAALSPGFLILERLIEHFCTNGQADRISFVTGVDWIDRWHPSAEPVGTFYTGNGTLYGKLALKALNLSLRKKHNTGKGASLNKEIESA